MHATAISNAVAATENASALATPSLLPFDPTATLPFNAIFQAILKGTANNSKFPAPGKAQDTSREPARAQGPGNAVPQVLPQPQNAVVAPAIAPVLLSAAAAAPAVLTAATPEHTAPTQATTLSELSDSLPAAALSNFAPSLSVASNSAPLVPGKAPTPAPATTASPAPSAAKESVPPKAFPDVPGHVSDETNAQPVTASQTDAPARNLNDLANGLAAGVENVFEATPALPPVHTSAEVPTPTLPPAHTSAEVAPPALPPAYTSAEVPTSALPPAHTGSQVPAPPQSADPVASSNTSAAPKSAPPLQPLAPPASAAASHPAIVPAGISNQGGGVLPVADPNWSALEEALAQSQSQSQGQSQLQSQEQSQVAVTNPKPPATFTVQSNPANPPANPASAPATQSSPTDAQTSDATPSLFSLLSARTPAPLSAGGAAEISVAVSQKPASSRDATGSVQPLANPVQSPSGVLAHSVATSAAVGATAFQFHDSVTPSVAKTELPAPAVAATPAKAGSQEFSNGSSASSASSGNDTNSKPDHVSNAAASNDSNVRTDEKNFVQTLSTAAANPPGGHAAVVDPSVVPAPAPQQGTSAPAPQAAASSADALPAQSLPASSESAPVVNAAHLVEQPGQTEIRIEMQADSLGGVELRAHIVGDQIGASIAVEHHDAQMALATDLPALHSALAEKNLRVETLSVSQGSFASLSGGAGQDTGQRNFTQSPAKLAYAEQAETAEASAESPVEWTSAPGSTTGLSVVA